MDVKTLFLKKKKKKGQGMKPMQIDRDRLFDVK